jgi:hypothetical protein
MPPSPLTASPTSDCTEVQTRIAITDRYRCPERFVTTCLSAPLSPTSGYFHFGNDLLCYGRSSVDFPVVADPKGLLLDLIDDVRADGTQLLLPFNPTQVVNSLRYEHYTGVSNGGAMATGPGAILGQLYYCVRPFLPTSVRKHFQRAYLRGWDRIPFPHWPLDVTVERLFEKLLLLLMKATGIEAIPFIWFWPDGADSAAMMTHDVETAAGRDFCTNLMDIDESFDIHSSFQVVPEQRYEVTPAFLAEIRSRGHEINVQDLNHDGRLFRDRAEFDVRVKRINQYGREFGARGFRAAVLYHNLNWYDQLDFEYDMSVPNIGHLEAQRGGCCTIFPYFIGSILELPLTTTQDYSLFHILHDYTLGLWKTQAAGVMAKHGLLSFIVHPDYLLGSKAQDTYRSLLTYLCQLRDEHRMWIATPNEINKWWRLRSRMTLALQKGCWRIVGPGSERAQIAYARAQGDEIFYTHDEA